MDPMRSRDQPGNWRRERDSNPRYPFGYNGFQDRRHQPLGHPSALRLSGEEAPRSKDAGPAAAAPLQCTVDILQRADPYDAIVVGSGPAGSIAARELTLAGARVLLLEGGRPIEPHELAGHKWPWQFPRRGAWDERQRPFYPDEIDDDVRLDGDEVAIDRVRALGGRSLHWNAVTLRFSEDDFREGSQHGL